MRMWFLFVIKFIISETFYRKVISWEVYNRLLCQAFAQHRFDRTNFSGH